MSSLDLNRLMLEYSKKGFQDWNNEGHDLQAKSRECLSNAIIEKDDDVAKMIRGQKNSLFIPMPKISRKGFEWCFFLPKITHGNLKSLILFLLVNRARQDCLAFRFECLAFRFESPYRQNTPHGYLHMQLTKRIEDSSSAKNLQGVPEWFPDSYPAFPIPAHDPLEMFLCMVTAVHGLHGGVDKLFKDIFQEAAHPNEARKYIRRLYEMLNTNP